jgi:hypothetical protein
LILKTFPDGFMPFVGADIKTVFEELKQAVSPDLIFSFDCRYILVTVWQALVSTGNVSLAHAVARDGMQRSQRLR